MYASDFAFQKQNGEWVYPSEKEVDRLFRDNAKAAKKLNAAKDAWAYWGRFNAKQAKKGGIQ